MYKRGRVGEKLELLPSYYLKHTLIIWANPDTYILKVILVKIFIMFNLVFFEIWRFVVFFHHFH